MLAVVEDGMSVTDVVAKVGVSRQTLHMWLARCGSGAPPAARHVEQANSKSTVSSITRDTVKDHPSRN